MGRTTRRSDEEFFEETLSLIDLPITPIRTSSDPHHQSKSSTSCRFRVKQEDVTENRACSDSQTQEEFKFGSLSGSPSTHLEMSTADELFLHGRILPLRLSVDSKMTRVSNPVRPEYGGSDSVSQGRSSSVGFTSNSSSRSSSYSSTSSRSVNNAVLTTPYMPKIRNQFHAHPSPKPQIRGQQKSHLNRRRKSSVWDIFRLGPVHAPEIELKDLKQRKPNRTNHSLISKNSDLNDQINVNKKETLKQRLSFGGCRCSVDDVESRIVVIKSSNNKKNNGEPTTTRRSDFHGGDITEELRRKREEMKKKMKKQGPETEESNRRTFEWLRQLSIGGQNDHGADNLNME